MYLSNHLFLLQNFKDTDIFEDPSIYIPCYLPPFLLPQRQLFKTYPLSCSWYHSQVYWYIFIFLLKYKSIHKQYIVILKL